MNAIRNKWKKGDDATHLVKCALDHIEKFKGCAKVRCDRRPAAKQSAIRVIDLSKKVG